MIPITPRSFLCEPILLDLGFRLIGKDPILFAKDIESKQHKTSTIYLKQDSSVVYNRVIYTYTAFRINSYSKRNTEVAYYDEFELRSVNDLNKFLRYLNTMAGF